MDATNNATATATRKRLRGIQFPHDQVRNILAGTQDQTRRPMNPQPTVEDGKARWHPNRAKFDEASGEWVPGATWDSESNVAATGAAGILNLNPFGKVGDRLYVKEPYAIVRFTTNEETGFVDGVEEWDGEPPASLPEGWTVVYATESDDLDRHKDDRLITRYKGPVLMPRWAARLEIEILAVDARRVKTILGREAWREGIRNQQGDMALAKREFRRKWDETYGKICPFDSNPYAWELTFAHRQITDLPYFPPAK